MTEPLYEHMQARSARISSKGDLRLLGSAAVISDSGIVATLAHVVEGYIASDVVIEYSDRTLNVKAISITPESDFAVLYPATGSTADFRYFVINAQRAQLGRSVIVYGWPARTSGHHYYRITEIASGRTVTEHQTNIRLMGFAERGVLSLGMSGAPVADVETGEIVGLAYGYDKEQSFFGREGQPPFRTVDRLDDFFVPFADILSFAPTLKDIATVNNEDRYGILLEQLLEGVRLLGFNCHIEDPLADQRPLIVGQLNLGPLTLRIIGLAADIPGSGHGGIRMQESVRRVQEAMQATVDRILVIFDHPDESTVRHSYGMPESWVTVRASRLLTDLIDAASYINVLIRRWADDRSGIAKRYVPLRAHRLTVDDVPTLIDDAENWILNWLNDADTPRKLLVLGTFGSGKSTLIRHLAYRMARRVDGSPSPETPVPLIIRLRDVRTHSLEHVISRLMQQELGANAVQSGLYERLSHSGHLIGLFDGLDEMSNSPTQSSPYEHMRELISLAPSPQKLLVTSRLEYFAKDEDFYSLMRTEDFESVLADDDFEVILLDPFTDEQIDTYLNNIFSGDELPGIAAKLDAISNAREIGRRPLMLDMVISSLGTLAEKSVKLNLATLYRVYTEKWLNRDVQIGRSAFPREAKQRLLEYMAIEMNRQGTLSIDSDSVVRILSRNLGDDFSRAAFYARDILTHSLLTRNEVSDTYEFLHKSFFEYLLAAKFCTDLRSDKRYEELTEDGFGTRRLGSAIIHFMAEIGFDQRDAWRLLESARHSSIHQIGFTGGNAITLLRSAGADFRNRDFDDMTLLGAVFAGTDLTDSTFRRATLFDCGFSNAILDNVDMGFAEIARCDFKAGTIITSLAVSSATSLIASDNSSGRLVSLWAVSDQFDALVSKRQLAGHTDDVFAVDFSPSGNALATAGRDQAIRVWDLSTFKPAQILRGHIGDIFSIAFCDEATIVSCSLDGQVIVWDSMTGKRRLRIDAEAEIWGVSASIEEGIISTGALNGDVKVYNLVTGEEIAKRNFSGPQPRRHPVCIVPGTYDVLSGTEDGSLIRWNCGTDQWAGVSSGHGAVKSIAVHVSDSVVATGHEDGSIVLWSWDLRPAAHWMAHDSYVATMRFRPGQSTLVSAGPDGFIKVWDSITHSVRLSLHEDFEGIQFSCNGLLLEGVIGLPSETRARLLRAGAVG